MERSRFSERIHRPRNGFGKERTLVELLGEGGEEKSGTRLTILWGEVRLKRGEKNIERLCLGMVALSVCC
jgi:hypothetical protein